MTDKLIHPPFQLMHSFQRMLYLLTSLFSFQIDCLHGFIYFLRECEGYFYNRESTGQKEKIHAMAATPNNRPTFHKLCNLTTEIFKVAAKKSDM